MLLYYIFYAVCMHEVVILTTLDCREVYYSGEHSHIIVGSLAGSRPVGYSAPERARLIPRPSAVASPVMVKRAKPLRSMKAFMCLPTR